MLAKLADKPFDDPNWIYEIKWDGYRAIAEVNGNKTRLYSRNGRSFAELFPGIWEALKQLGKKRVILDGEIVAFNDQGMPSFQHLQQYSLHPDTPLEYYVFDILSYNGQSVKELPLLDRKELLRSLLPNDGPIRYCDHIEQSGIAFFEQLKKKGLEGMIAKRSNSKYQEGARNGSWLKVKHVLTDEAVIAGFTEPRGGRAYFGALVLGTYEKGKLSYIGHTGTGFNDKALREVYERMQPLITSVNPFGKKVRVNMPVTWVKPELVCRS